MRSIRVINDMTAAAAADVVLSDVHCEVVTTKHSEVCHGSISELFIQPCVFLKNVATSRFPFQLPFPFCNNSVPDHDDDGDIVVERRQQHLFVIGMLILHLM